MIRFDVDPGTFEGFNAEPEKADSEVMKDHCSGFLCKSSVITDGITGMIGASGSSLGQVAV